MTTPAVITLREVQVANRRLIAAMKRRRVAATALRRAETEVREARRYLRLLLDSVATPDSTADRPLCGECQKPLGSTPACLECSAMRAVD